MDFGKILLAAGIVGAMGLIFGAILAIVSRIFAVKEDPRKELVRAELPGANCGGCGFPGCDGYAQALVDGKAEPNRCAAAGAKGAEAIANILGLSVNAFDKKVAVVRCRGSLDKCNIRFEYKGPKTCKAANVAAVGDKSCQFSCLGFGDCVSACRFGAVSIKDGRLAEVDQDKCLGCGACVDACPRSTIQLIPAKHAVQRVCSAMDRGKVVRDNCVAGCLGCGKCARSCKFGALTMVNNLPQIDMDLCVGCMQCADNCPTGALQANDLMRRHAVIHYPDCTGCGDCASVCQFEAITGEKGGKYSVIEWNCVGCGKCFDACEHGCVEMREGGVYNRK